MTDSAVYNSSGKRTKLFIQRRGAGFPLIPADAETDVEGASGGEVAYTSYWSNGRYMRRRKTGNPSDRTFNIKTVKRFTKVALRELGKTNELFNAFVFSEMNGYDVTTARYGTIFIDTSVSAPGADKPLVSDTSGDESQVMETYSAKAGVEEELRQAVHLRSGVTTVNAAINHGIYISDTYQEVIAVGAAVTTTVPRIYYYRLNEDGSKTFKSLTLTGIANGTAVRVALSGNRILIAVTGTNAGLYSASLSAVKAASTTVTATLVSGIAAATVVNDVKAIGKYIFAVGNAGNIWISRDGGFSFVLLGTPAAVNFTEIGGVSDKDVWFGGANGTLANWYLENALTVLTPSVITGDAVTSIAVPARESSDDQVRRWVYVGTNTGEIWYSMDGGATWTRMAFADITTGTIAALEFVGLRGIVLGIVHTDATPISRVFLDYSGGAGGAALREVTTPTNAGINSLALFDLNTGMTFGETVSSLGFVGDIVG